MELKYIIFLTRYGFDLKKGLKINNISDKIEVFFVLYKKREHTRKYDYLNLLLTNDN